MAASDSLVLLDFNLLILFNKCKISNRVIKKIPNFTQLLKNYMFLNPRFYYNDGGSEGGGTPDAVVTDPVVTIPEDVQKELAELRAFKEQISNKEPDKTAEQLSKEQEIEKAEFLRYSAKNDLLKIDEYNQYESLKSKADRDLVFENYLQEWKKENPDVKDESEIAAKAKEDFEDEYKLNSENEKAKNKGISRLAKEAKELKAPIESKYTTAKERFAEDREIVSKIPEFNKAIDEIIKESTPDKIVVKTKDGEQVVDIEVELTKEQRAEVEKIFKSDKVFATYYNSDDAEKGTFKAKGFDTGKKIGIAQGSNVGANNPFPLKEDQKQETKIVSIDESTAKVAEARKKYGR
jgi:hypothetical protein